MKIKIIICINLKGEPPSYRDFHSATAIGSLMYVFGGRGDSEGPYHSQVHCSAVHMIASY